MFLIPYFGLKIRKETVPFLSQNKMASIMHHPLQPQRNTDKALNMAKGIFQLVPPDISKQWTWTWFFGG